jgi:hypothetical protein
MLKVIKLLKVSCSRCCSFCKCMDHVYKHLRLSYIKITSWWRLYCLSCVVVSYADCIYVLCVDLIVYRV